MNRPILPNRVEDLTCDWLTHALRESGVLREARVVGVEQELLGGGEGFMGQVIRLHIDLDRPEGGAPRTLIAKLPTDVKENRAIGELLGAYEREILFYGELAPRLTVRTPRFYYANMETRGTSKHEASMAALMDRWPMWVIRWMMVLVTWIASRRRGRYVLLIENFSAGRAGDQVAGCSPDAARSVLAEIAKVHAQHWNSAHLKDVHWLRRLVLNPRTMHSMFMKNLPGFSARFGSRRIESFESSLRWLERNGVDLLRVFGASAPETLLHCDLRLDNLWFLPADLRQREAPVFLDWQLTGRGPGAYDVAYFLSGAIPGDVPDEVVLELVRGYHQELVAHGVTDYSFDRFLSDYQRGLLSVLHRVSSTDTMDLGDGRGSELIAAWLERCLARLRGSDYGALLDAPVRR